MRKLPFVEAKIQSELNKMMEGTLKELKAQTNNIPFYTRIPEAGWNREKIIGNIKEMMNLSKFDYCSTGNTSWEGYHTIQAGTAQRTEGKSVTATTTGS